MTKIRNLYGLILTGGFSRRMGQDKALLMYHQKPQIEYIHDLLGNVCEQIFLSKRQDQTTYKNLPFIDDLPEFSHIGPLGGILSAMKSHPQTSWLVIACDLPFVNQETLEELICHRNLKKIATAFKSSHPEALPEPLCAIWEGSSYSQILDCFQKGMTCPRKILINNDTQLLEQKNPRWLDNVNDLKEFQQAIENLKN